MSVDIHVIVPTCDKYAPIIPKWLTFFYRHWTLPHHVTIIGVTFGSLKCPRSLLDNPIKARHVLYDRGWAGNLLAYLSDIGDDPIMMLMDDHILFEVNVNLVNTAWEIIHRPDVGCVRLVPWPGPTLPYDVDGFGEIDKSLEYAISLQASMWKPQTFRDLLDPRWNPWQIELEGSKRARTYGKRFIGCKTCAVNYKDYYCRGKPRDGHAQWVDEHL